MEQNRELKVYYKNIMQDLPCGYIEKRILLKELKKGINDYLIDNPSANIDDVMSTFGTCNEIRKSYNNNPTYYKKKVKHAKIMLILSIIISFIIICILIYGIVDFFHPFDGHIITTVQGSKI